LRAKGMDIPQNVIRYDQLKAVLMEKLGGKQL